MTTDTETTAEACRLAVGRLSERTGLQWTFGYIGNTGPGFDDRRWYAFAPHPGRTGTANDRVGGYSTRDLDKLHTAVAGAIAILNVLDRKEI